MDTLQWGNRKRLRCVKVKSRVDRRGVVERENLKQSHPPSTNFREFGINRSSLMEDRKIGSSSATSPEKEDRYYPTRGSGGLIDKNAKLFKEVKANNNSSNNKKLVWPKLYISLSSKEKEEDFMAMKGCKLPQRPKKRAKQLQRTLLMVSPGAWLSELCQERYEVREKKASKKKPRGLKAMGGMESDSE